ncbi:hypothetical protein EDB86DRAFT_2838317 [Lactarius hatsudake]|nr:hypothetical protein EDB86DRAFT_2838317 [Lactarius hatsudake]
MVAYPETIRYRSKQKGKEAQRNSRLRATRGELQESPSLKTEAMHCCYLQPHNRKISHPDLSLEHIHEPPSVKQDRRVALVKRYQGMLAQAFRRCMSEMSRTIIAGNSLGGSGTAERWEPRTKRAYRKAQGAYGKEPIGFVDHTELLEVEAGRYSRDCVVCYANSNVFHIPVVLSTNEELRPGGSSRAITMEMVPLQGSLTSTWGQALLVVRVLLVLF